MPLGLWHADHKMTARACLRVASYMPERRWVLYEELPYRVEVPLEVAAGKDQLAIAGFSIEPLVIPSNPGNSKKRAMINCYRSQLRCLGPRADVAAAEPEVFYRLTSRAR